MCLYLQRQSLQLVLLWLQSTNFIPQIYKYSQQYILAMGLSVSHSTGNDLVVEIGKQKSHRKHQSLREEITNQIPSRLNSPKNKQKILQQNPLRNTLNPNSSIDLIFKLPKDLNRVSQQQKKISDRSPSNHKSQAQLQSLKPIVQQQFIQPKNKANLSPQETKQAEIMSNTFKQKKLPQISFSTATKIRVMTASDENQQQENAMKTAKKQMINQELGASKYIGTPATADKDPIIQISESQQNPKPLYKSFGQYNWNIPLQEDTYERKNRRQKLPSMNIVLSNKFAESQQDINERAQNQVGPYSRRQIMKDVLANRRINGQQDFNYMPRCPSAPRQLCEIK